MTRRFAQLVFLGSLLAQQLSVGALAQSRATPREPIAGLLDAFKTHQVVGVPDAHRNTAIHAFLLSLIRDSRFPKVVNDVVVEFGNPLHQDVADRFVRGEDVSYRVSRQDNPAKGYAAPSRRHHD